MKERDKNLNVRVRETELAQLHSLSEAADLPASTLVRQWIRDHYAAKFGDVAPSKMKR